MSEQRKTIVYIASSLDGFIAKPGDDLSFLSMVEREGEDYGYSTFMKTIDTVVIGRKTYDWVMTQVPVFPHADLPTYVITRTPKPTIGKTEFYADNLTKLIFKLKSELGRNIFIDGGAEIINELIKDNLIDEYIISIIPVLLGSGIRLFKNGLPETKLNLISAKLFESGLVQLHYSNSR